MHRRALHFAAGDPALVGPPPRSLDRLRSSESEMRHLVTPLRGETLQCCPGAKVADPDPLCPDEPGG